MAVTVEALIERIEQRRKEIHESIMALPRQIRIVDIARAADIHYANVFKFVKTPNRTTYPVLADIEKGLAQIKSGLKKGSCRDGKTVMT